MMRHTAMMTLLGALALAPFDSGAALAQTDGQTAASAPSCSCPMTISAYRQNPGRIIAVKGEVLISGEDGFGPAQSGARLSVGSQLMTGGKGSAVLAFGKACQIGISPNSSANIARTANGKLCVTVLDRTATAAMDDSLDGDRLATTAILGGTLASGLISVGIGHNEAASH